MKQTRDNLSFCLRWLIGEDPQYSNMSVPESGAQRRAMMRALLNVRPPRPIGEEFLAAQNAELQAQLQEKGVVSLGDIPACGRDKRLRIWQGDITRLSVDAIVNAANSRMLGCFVPLHGCIDNAIHSAAGVELRLECDRQMKRSGVPEPVGGARITAGYNLPARHVLHTVGPIISAPSPTAEQERQLASCYRSCLKLADSRSLKSLAFCCISTGEFRFPRRPAAEIAVSTVVDYLDANPRTTIETVIFNVFKDEDLFIYKRLLG